MDTSAKLTTFIETAINQREVFLEQLQLFVTGAMRHPQLVNKDGAARPLAGGETW